MRDCAIRRSVLSCPGSDLHLSSILVESKDISAFPLSRQVCWTDRKRVHITLIQLNRPLLTVSRNDLLCWHTGLGLKAVNILSVAPQQQALLVQQCQEEVGSCGLEFARKELLHSKNSH